MLVFSRSEAPGRMLFLPIVLLATFMLATAANAQQIHDVGRSSHDVRKQLYALTSATQELVNNVGRFQQLNPVLVLTLNNQILALQNLTPEELDSLAAARLELDELRQMVVELNILIAEQMIYADVEYESVFDPEETGFIADGYRVGCPAGGGALYGDFETILHTPGPCGQSGLTDAGYPYICPFSTPAGVLIISRVALAIAKTIASSTEKICSQSVFGNNTATGCIVLEGIRLVLLAVLDTLANCNDKRSAAETFGTYTRAGDIFFSNKTNFATQNTTMQATVTQVGDAEISLTIDVNTARAKMDEALESGFSGTGALLTELETKAIKNSQSLDLVLARQRLIMRELNIEPLYRDPNTNPTSINSYDSGAVSEKKSMLDSEQTYELIGVAPERNRR